MLALRTLYRRPARWLARVAGRVLLRLLPDGARWLTGDDARALFHRIRTVHDHAHEATHAVLGLAREVAALRAELQALRDGAAAVVSARLDDDPTTLAEASPLVLDQGAVTLTPDCRPQPYLEPTRAEAESGAA